MDNEFILIDDNTLIEVVCVTCYKSFWGNTNQWDDPVKEPTFESESRTFICNDCWFNEIDE